MNHSTISIVFLSIMLNTSNAFTQGAKYLDVLITEIFPDPSPSVGLPQQEFIELKNVSTTAVNLKDWKISDGKSTAVITNDHVMQPDSMVILCSNGASAVFRTYGFSIGVTNFPSLENDEDVLWLQSSEGFTIHAVLYKKTWYKNDMKSTGGWTLEMIDTKNACAGSSNWKASIEGAGGTPGKINSIDGHVKDDIAPALLRTYIKDSNSIIAVFDETIDSISATITSNFLLDKALHPVLAIPVAPLFTEVTLKFSSNLTANIVYELNIKNIADCAGNSLGIRNTAKAGLPVVAGSSDIVINEILFNPKSTGFDFIELYNRSNKIFDLKNLYVANRNATGGMTNIIQVSSVHVLMFPGDYIVLTESSQWLSQNYVVKNYESILELSSLPSLPDDNGQLVISNLQATVIEELHYDSKWHFPLINNKEGISLERIDYSHATQDKHNWTSAASTSGFATPGYENSQIKAGKHLQGMVSIPLRVFSPDGDGLDDFATIHYQMESPGFVANIIVFDVNGRPVRYLERNTTLSSHGFFRWDGLDDKLQKLPIGVYIVFTEVFNLQGKTKKFKNVLTLARRF